MLTSSTRYRWGSILGLWDGAGMGVYFGEPCPVLFFTPWWLWTVVAWPLVQRFLWAGMRNRVDWSVWHPPVH